MCILMSIMLAIRPNWLDSDLIPRLLENFQLLISRSVMMTRRNNDAFFSFVEMFRSTNDGLTGWTMVHCFFATVQTEWN